MKKSELLKMLEAVRDFEEIKFEALIAGIDEDCTGDFDCSIRLFYNEDDHTWRLRMNGDSLGESGWRSEWEN